MLHILALGFMRIRFNIRTVTVRGADRLARLVHDGQSVLVAPNHADHADPSLLIEVGRRHGLAFHFMAARESFERGWFRRFVLQRAGAFSVDREGADLAAVRAAMTILRECRHPLVIFPEGEIYHHHEELDLLNDGVATILLRAAEKLPNGRRSYVVPTVIRIAHDTGVTETFSSRLDALERRITWKPQRSLDVVDRIYRLGGALVSIKEAEYMGNSRFGPLIERIHALQRYLVQSAEQRHGLCPGDGPIPLRIKAVRQRIRRELLSDSQALRAARRESLYDDLDRLFAAQQLYSYTGRYLRRYPTIDRIAETIFKLEEDVLGIEVYPAPRSAEIIFDEPIDVAAFLESARLNTRSGVEAITQLLRQRIEALQQQGTAHQGQPPPGKEPAPPELVQPATPE